jgi:polar amino acid transport system substrate-binding protein
VLQRGIRQAVAVAKGKQPPTIAFLAALVEDLKASGFIAAALARSGQVAAIAPAGG